MTGEQSLVTVGEPDRPRTAETTTTQTTTVVQEGGELQMQITIVSDSIESIKNDLTALEEALEKLKELTGGE